jgi:hypothetical protein
MHCSFLFVAQSPLLEPLDEGGAGEPQLLGGAILVVMAAAQGALDELALQPLH